MKMVNPKRFLMSKDFLRELFFLGIPLSAHLIFECKWGAHSVPKSGLKEPRTLQIAKCDLKTYLKAMDITSHTYSILIKDPNRDIKLYQV